MELVNKIKKPFVIRHNFLERSQKLGIFVLRYNHLNSSDSIEVEAPTGETKKLLRRYKGHTLGLDFDSYSQDLISLISSKIAKTQFSANSFSASNPGFSFMGQAKNKIAIYEAIDTGDNLERPYARITRIWNGWRIKVEKAKKILEKIKKKYNLNFFSDYVLGQTKKLFLYNINVNIFVHTPGMEHLLALSEENTKAIFMQHQSRDNINFTGDDVLLFSGYKKFIKLKEKYLKQINKGNKRRASNLMLRMISVLEDKLTVKGLEAMFGSKDNFLVLARVDGFRIGDESDKEIISNTFGKYGSDSLYGPSSEMMSFIKRNEGEGMIEGEFYLNWLLGRLI